MFFLLFYMYPSPTHLSLYNHAWHIKRKEDVFSQKKSILLLIIKENDYLCNVIKVFLFLKHFLFKI